MASMNLESGTAQLFEQFSLHWERFVVEAYGENNHINKVISYIISPPGKQIRPLLCLLSTEALGGDIASAIRPAIALEMIHTYSLVHDDLPCMDDDELRRGRPTAHVEFNEGLAVLGGDALLTDAFAVLNHQAFAGCLSSLPLKPKVANLLTAEIALASGSRGMVLGQATDLYWTNEGEPTYHQLETLHLHKTGALLGAACACGAIVSEQSTEVVDRFRNFGRRIGLAFQIVDDLLDGNEGTGKTQGKDRAQNKFTFLSEFDKGQAEQIAQDITAQAINDLSDLGLRSPQLVNLANQLLARRY